MNHRMHSKANDLYTSDDPIARDYQEVNDRMHAQIALHANGDADVDFLKKMIPYHQGAIDMARIVVIHGSDPQVREFAEAIIITQTTAIDFLKMWLQK